MRSLTENRLVASVQSNQVRTGLAHKNVLTEYNTPAATVPSMLQTFSGMRRSGPIQVMVKLTSSPSSTPIF